MGARIDIVITDPAPGDVTLDASNMFQVQGDITPSDPSYTIRAYLINKADLTNPIVGTLVQQTADTFHFTFTVPTASQHVSLYLSVVAEDGNDAGGLGFSVRCVPQ